MKKTWMKLGGLILTASLTMELMVPFTWQDKVKASGESTAVVYNLNQMNTYKDRSYETVGAAYSKALNTGSTYKNASSASYYKVAPSLSNPYAVGEMSEDTHKAMTGMTNFYRWLVGDDEFQTVSTHSEELQAGALVRNFQFAHAINAANKPEDMSDTLWNQGANADHNILAKGHTPRGAISGWMNEGHKVYSYCSCWNYTGILFQSGICTARG